ncbi:UNVERIFIED_CONTAM: hypothetical protein FKN15_014958 [Acipenser sinensis]
MHRGSETPMHCGHRCRERLSTEAAEALKRQGSGAPRAPRVPSIEHRGRRSTDALRHQDTKGAEAAMHQAPGHSYSQWAKRPHTPSGRASCNAIP